MKELIIKGKQEFMGLEIPVVYGGFGENQKVILARDIAKIHDVEVKRINELINKNIDEFEDNIDIIDLKNNSDLEVVATDLGFINSNSQKYCYLLSEQGYMLLVGFMKSPKAKEIRKQLRREYFKMKEIIVSESKTEIEKSNSAIELVNKLDKQLDELGQFYRVTHKRKLDINKYIKKSLGTNATKENCDRVKELLLIQLGYDTYEQVPKGILLQTDTYKKIFDICYMISCNDGQLQIGLEI